MSEQEQVIPVPEVMRQLIQHQNNILNKHQQKMFDELGVANVELMKIMGLDPIEGWQLDLNRLAYIRIIPGEQEEVEEKELLSDPDRA
jgi:hypothetical protein